jgi:hypothetical protein
MHRAAPCRNVPVTFTLSRMVAKGVTGQETDVVASNPVSRSDGLFVGEWVSRHAVARPQSLFWGWHGASHPESEGTRARWAHRTVVACQLAAPWHSTAGALPLLPMKPFTCQHRLRKLRPGMPAWLALAATARLNKSIDTDVLSAGFAGLLAAGHLQR